MLVVVASSPGGTVMLDQHSEHHLGPHWELRKYILAAIERICQLPNAKINFACRPIVPETIM